MKKLLNSIVLTSLAFGSITTSVYAAPTVVEQFNDSPGYGMYGFPTKQYITTYSQPSTTSRVVGTIRRNGAIPVYGKTSNGWYETTWHKNGVKEYIQPGDLQLVREPDIGNYPETTYPFPNVGVSAPTPSVTVPPITTKPTNDNVGNIETISKTLGFTKKTRVDGIDYYYFAPNGEIVKNWGRSALQFHHVPNSPQRYGEFRLLIGGWVKTEDTTGQMEKVPAAVREILKFYYPTNYEKIYSMLHNGFTTDVDMDEFLNTNFILDNRELRVEFYEVQGTVGLYIGKYGERYTNSFSLPNNVALVYVNGKQLITDQPAIVDNGQTFVPLREIFEALGADVVRDEATHSLVVTRGSSKITLAINSKTATINGKTVTLDVAPSTKNGTTIVPVRFISQALGAKITWDDESKTVFIEQ